MLSEIRAWAQKAYIEGVNFVAFDVETTGLDPRFDRIVEIGAVKFDKKGIIARFSTLVNPGIPMPAEAARVNNITDRMLVDKPSLDEVYPDFQLFVRNSVLTAHNAPFDLSFIKLPNRIIDTLILSRELLPGHMSYSLQNLALDLQLPSVDAHRAENDARLCMEIFILCLGLTPSPLLK